jgi:DNA-binding transcriptional MerR regulator
MARCSNNTLRTVRFYEEEGILRPAKRTEGGHRLFGREELDRLMLVTDLRLAGLSLDEIKHILAVKERGKEAAQEAVRALTQRIDELKEKLDVLARLRADLTETTDIMSACIKCTDGLFPSSCGACQTLSSRPTLPRSMKVLWTTSEARPAAEAEQK